jgi:hypothetical protein
MVADEFDAAHAGLGAFGDRKDQIDAVVRPVDDLRIDPHVEHAAAVIDFDDALHVCLHRRPRQGPARLRLDFRLQLFVLGLGIALEGDAVDDRVFFDRDDQMAADMGGLDVLEQAGGDKRLEAFVFLLGGHVSARAVLEIGPDGIGLDPSVTFDFDGICVLGDRNASGCYANDPRPHRDSAEDNATKGQSP